MIDHVLFIVLAYAAGAAWTPEDALAVLNVMPRHDWALAAVLSRGFLPSSLAVTHGHGLKLLPHYPRHILCCGNLLGQTLMADRSGRKCVAIASLTSQLTLAMPEWWAGWLERVAIEANLDLGWHRVDWHAPAMSGHFGLLTWALNHGHLPKFTAAFALDSAALGDLSFLAGWLSDQPNTAAAIAEINDSQYSDRLFLTNASLTTLD
ncbi:hypothetical protein BC828DRAFT_409999 [Blastocladiella britannica]|nr:hypothetical protein BC828DRAFT_409999 [Blastocladiella britannica]